MPFKNSIIVTLKEQQVNRLTYYLSKDKRAHPINGLELNLDKDFVITKALIKNKKRQSLLRCYK